MKREHDPEGALEFYPSKKMLTNIQEVDQSDNPIYIIAKKIYLSTLSPLYKEAYNTLVQICVPQSRPTYMHEYSITPTSIMKAITLGYTSETITSFLMKYMRNKEIPSQLRDFVKRMADKYSGSAKMHLDETEEGNFFYLDLDKRAYFLLAEEPEFRRYLAEKKDDEEEGSVVCKLEHYTENRIAEFLYRKEIPFHYEFPYKRKVEIKRVQPIYKNQLDLAMQGGRILLKELKIELKTFTKLRNYQQAALKSIFFVTEKKVNGQIIKEDTAKSGIIVLPCGAGKTLLGISVACKIKKETLIVCSGEVGVEQWKREILKWTSEIQPNQIVTLTSKTQKLFKYNVKDYKTSLLVISSYPFLASKLIKKEEGYHQFEWVKRLPWGLVLFDEVQWLPATGYSEILNNIQTHVRIGLTATLYREDNKISLLDYIIGPLLYEGNWRDFVDSGYLANPYCIEIRVELTPHFRAQYHSAEQRKEAKEMIYCANPNKIKALVYLLHIHESRNDQIIIFCDSIPLILYVARMLKRPAIYGQLPVEDKNFIYEMFRRGKFKTILISRTGDEAIDLPNANVAIELTINRGSRKQVLQRLGRIMRQKDNPTMDYNALFYTLVSEHTSERIHFMKRQKTLVDLGFQYDIINEKDMEYNQPNNPLSKILKKFQIVKEEEYLRELNRDLKERGE